MDRNINRGGKRIRVNVDRIHPKVANVHKSKTANMNGDDKMETEEPVKLNCMKNIRNIAQKAIKEQGLTERQIRKSLGIKRYEK